MLPNSAYTFEICVDTAESLAAAAPFADRIELCTGLDIGGLTPDHGLMALAAESGIETHVLIRGRSGDFSMGPDDLAAACANITAVRQLGLHGVVIGVEKSGSLDLDALGRLVAAADGLALTLHRVIDVLDDPLAALETVISLGFHRVLTSGGAAIAPLGVEGLQRLHDAARGRIEIMAGGGIKSSNLPELMGATTITSFHASCSTSSPLDARYTSFGFGSHRRLFDHGEAVRMAQILKVQSDQGEIQ